MGVGYGPATTDPNRQAAGYIDRVLQGEKLANLGAAADQV